MFVGLVHVMATFDDSYVRGGGPRKFHSITAYKILFAMQTWFTVSGGLSNEYIGLQNLLS